MILLTPKERKTLVQSVQSLFSPRAFIAKPNIEYFQDIRNLAGIKNVKGKQVFLSPRIRDVYSQLTNLIIGKREIADLFTRDEVFQQVAKSHEELLSSPEDHCSDVYLKHVMTSLEAKIKDYKFLIPIDGIELTDKQRINVGNITICRSDKSVLSEVQFAQGEDEEIIFEQVKSKYWVIGEAHGGPEVARRNFDRSTQIAVGILAIYWSAMYKFAFLNTRVNPKLTPYDNRSSTISLRWVNGGGELSTSRDWGHHQNIKLSSKLLTELTSNLFFNQFSNLTSFNSKTELHCALRTAILWFYDSYKDQNITMKFIKLWSCSECFFSKKQNTITNDNATGIASILAYAGYQVISPNEYNTTRTKLKKLYDLRSKAVHNAELEHITHKDINILARWISWLIISIFALTEQGYTTLMQVKEQIDRLDSIEAEASRATSQSNVEE